jgi:hypothetical protein
VLTWSASSAAQTFTITPSLIGTVTLTPTNSGGLTNPAAVTYAALIQLGRVNVQVNTSDNGGVRPTGGTRTPDLGGYVVFPTGPLAEFNRVITSDPVDPNSEAMMGANPTYGSSTINIEGYGPDWLAYGFPFAVVDSTTQPFVTTSYTDGDGNSGGEYYPTESDPGPFPIPDNAPVEGWTSTTPPTAQQSSDSHVIVLDRATQKLYELFKGYKIGSTWYAGGGFIFDLAHGGGGYTVGSISPTSPNLPSLGSLRKTGWTSADAAGLPIFPLLVRYDEAVTHGAIPHALRFTFQTAHTEKTYQWPARHTSGNVPIDPTRIPFGARMRLKSAWYAANASSFTGAARAVVDALRNYGAYNADGGIDFDLCFVQDDRWDQTNLNTLRTIPASAFEVLQIKPGYTISVSSTTTTVGSPITVTFSRLPIGDTNFDTDFYPSEDGGSTFVLSPTFVATGSITMSDANPSVVFTYTPQSAGTKQIQALLDPTGFVPAASIAVTVTSGGLTAGSVTVSGIGSTGAFLSTTSASGGTAPWSYQFQIAPDVAGSPGTWTNVGPDLGFLSYLATGLSASTTYWARVVVTDATSATVNSAAVSFATHASRTSTTVANGDWATGATWDNGTPGPGDLAVIHHNVTVTTPTAIGDGTAQTVLTCADGTVTVTGAVLTVRGNATFGVAYFSDTPTANVRLTIQSSSPAVAGLILDGNSGVSPVVTFGQACQMTIVGSAALRCFVRTRNLTLDGTASAGGHGSFAGTGPGSHLFVSAVYCDFSGIGDGATVGIALVLGTPDGICSFDHCTFDSCGSIPNVQINHGQATYSLTHNVWTNTLTAGVVGNGACDCFASTPILTGGVRQVTGNRFLATPSFYLPEDLTISGNYFDQFLQCTHGVPPWAAFDNNFVRKSTNNVETQTNGNVTNSFWLMDPVSEFAGEPGYFFHVSKYTSCLFSGNVFQYAGTLNNANYCINMTEGGVNNRTMTVIGNIVLPNGAGDSSGPLTQGFNNASDPNEPTTVVEHNTIAIGSCTAGAVLFLAYSTGSPPYPERTDMITSYRSNLIWRTGAAPGTGVYAVVHRAGTAPLTDAIHAVNCDYNAICGLDPVPSGTWLATSGSTDCMAGTPYNSPMSGSTPPGAHDVNLGAVSSVATAGPQFVDPTRNLATWDASLGGPGTKDHALAKLQVQSDPTAAGYDARYTTAALLAYVQGGFTPTNPALHNASYPGDSIPDLGAVPFSATAIATAYALTGPATGTSQVASSPLTVTPNGSYTGQITPSDGGAKGTFSPSALVWTGTADSKTFTYTPAAAGTSKISAAASPALANPASVSFSAAKKRALYLPRPRR